MRGSNVALLLCLSMVGSAFAGALLGAFPGRMSAGGDDDGDGVLDIFETA